MMGEVGALARRAYVAVRGSAAPPPLFSSTVLVAVAATYVASPLVSASALCLRPADLLGRLQLYRLNTAPLVHANLLHLAVNAVAWLSLAPAMEEASGTGAFAHLAFSLLVPLVGLAAAAGAYAVDAVAGTHSVAGCSVGLSGVLFGMLVIHLRRSGVTSVDVCGCFVMPARWYPLALVGLIQLAAPGRIALGAHLAGIAVGEATMAGAWGWITPTPSVVAAIEGGRPCGCVPPLTALPGYVSCAASLSGAVLPTTHTSPATPASSSVSRTAAALADSPPSTPPLGKSQMAADQRERTSRTEGVEVAASMRTGTQPAWRKEHGGRKTAEGDREVAEEGITRRGRREGGGREETQRKRDNGVAIQRSHAEEGT